MGALVHLLELGDGDFGIDRGGVHVGMAEELADEAQVSSVLEHVTPPRRTQTIADHHKNSKAWAPRPTNAGAIRMMNWRLMLETTRQESQ